MVSTVFCTEDCVVIVQVTVSRMAMFSVSDRVVGSPELSLSSQLIAVMATPAGGASDAI